MDRESGSSILALHCTPSFGAASVQPHSGPVVPKPSPVPPTLPSSVHPSVSPSGPAQFGSSRHHAVDTQTRLCSLAENYLGLAPVAFPRRQFLGMHPQHAVRLPATPLGTLPAVW